jgi:hypothetical protein
MIIRRRTLEVSTAENPVVGERATITEGWVRVRAYRQ